MSKRVMIGIRVDEEVKRDFMKWCIDNGTSIQKELESHILSRIGGNLNEDPDRK
ncbi:MAG: hypothetical protein M0Z65_10975 [Firmicutes bacterium]|uniref:Arc-like DNA binding domain-containing protein n=1 Tax=Kroppenstedtia guangzhouensis TaxID=1274356 RepID=A0ABQ1H494_9BACL|nr:hypothetical protein [Kroppenstedtia guangzhouensis]EGK10251.1 hypothetical protein HMPREF9374_2601 [Desmospora sp. 8437]MDA8353679.1 hypothetical protein [Bacillota bacterium]GGA57247.1 hypothetical protein GCM10007416_33060 [Kroppenstedtia guangzhouensis]